MAAMMRAVAHLSARMRESKLAGRQSPIAAGRFRRDGDRRDKHDAWALSINNSRLRVEAKAAARRWSPAPRGIDHEADYKVLPFDNRHSWKWGSCIVVSRRSRHYHGARIAARPCPWGGDSTTAEADTRRHRNDARGGCL